MAYSKKRLIAAAMAGVLAMMSAFPGYAASRKKITSVSVSIKADIEPETDFGQEIIEIESSSNRYSVDGYEILNEGFYWTEDMTPEIRITLTADDDYYFTALTKDKVTLKGGAEFKKSTRQQSSSVLLLDVTLSSLQNSLKDMEGITLSDNGIATWPAISTAGSYEVRVYREGKIVGTSLETNTNSANCRERMMKPNETYMVKVRAVNKYDPTVKGDWTESNSVYISGEKVAQFKAEGVDICLAVIQVGSDPASSVYVRNKKKACAYIGVESRSYELPEETSEEELIKLVEELNADESVNGILVQLPVPDHIDEDKIIRTISPDKDVDGFHPVSVGRLWIGEKGFLSCTPAGIIQLLKRSNISIEGKECVIIGRSNIVGKPMAALLLRENGTVTVAHSRTKDLKEVAKRADILIVAIGKERFITSEYIKEGAVVIDVGMHRDEANHLCGDVDFADVEPHSSAITPVPGGVGPMTIAMLMNNCVETVRK